MLLPRCPKRRLRRRLTRLLPALALGWIWLPDQAVSQHQADPAKVSIAATGLSVSGDKTLTRIVLDLTSPVDIKVRPLTGPDRLVIDLPQVVFSAAAGASAKGQGLVLSYRFGMFFGGGSRIVLDLGGPASLRLVRTDPGPAGTRLSIEIAAETRAAFDAAARAGEQAREPAAAAPPPRASSGAQTLPLIVIDPGHGGLDGGAGSGQVIEKALVLKFGLTLRERLEKSGLARVEMTRDSDVFVSLADRVRFARDRQAALMLSVHADSLVESGGVRGATVYTRAEKATDERSARLADKENRSDQLAGLDDREESDGVADILMDLTRRETRLHSAGFARVLVASLGRAIAIQRNSIRSARFRVLSSPDVPSILLELGYLTSPEDIRLMVSDEWREAAAAAVTDAIRLWLSGRSGPETTGTAPKPAPQ